jgi:hypothetical protein
LRGKSFRPRYARGVEKAGAAAEALGGEGLRNSHLDCGFLLC